MKNVNLRAFALALIMIGLVFSVWSAKADDDHNCQGGHNCNGGGTDVSIGDTNLSGGDTTVNTGGNESKALALANSLGDVDIAGCLGSTQFGTPLFSKQKLVLNQVCMAEFYLNHGKYDLAAMALCNVPEILKEFETESLCEDAHDFGPPPEPKPEIPPVTSYEHHEDIEQVQMAQTGLVGRLDQLEARLNRPSPKPVAVEQRPAFSEAQITGVWAALKGDEDE